MNNIFGTVRQLTLTIGLFLITITMFAQNDKQVAETLRNMGKAYAEGPLSFNVAYYYADEARPAQYLDSLKGEFRMYNKRFWYRLDSTEVLSDSSRIVTLFIEDKIMYLSRPATGGSQMNPFMYFDELLLKNKRIHCSLSKKGKDNQFVIDIDSGSVYKKMIYAFDPGTFLVNHVTLYVKASQLYEPEVRSLLENDDKYAIVEIVITNYYKNDPEALRFFETVKYFKQEGAQITAVAPYENYKIFLGTPNL